MNSKDVLTRARSFWAGHRERGRSSRFLHTLLALAFVASAMMGAVPPASAQGEAIAPQYTEPTWQATYWDNTTMSGYPALWRSEHSLNHNWGTGSPDPRINPDHFSARWVRYVDFTAGTYRFTVTADDGVRVWISGQLLIDGWRDQPPTTYTKDKYLETGEYVIMVEYYERAGGAMINFSWQLISQPAPDAWRGEYYNNMWLVGTPALVRHDPNIDFRWGYDSPAPGLVGSDYFSVRWTRQLDLSPGTYRLFMTVDDGGRLWVNNNLVIDRWHDTAPRTYTADVTLSGPVPVRMEYYENMGIAVAQLTWQRLETPPPPQEVIVDDTSPGFIKGGSVTGWNTAYTGYGGSMTWTRNNDWQRPNYNWARWYPSLQAGWYDVYVYVPGMYATTTNTQYWVSHYHGFTRRIVNQSANTNMWVNLGTYQFRGDSQDYVSLNDTTYEPYMSRFIAFDAVKWVRR